MMGKIIVPNAVERKPNHLYYIDGEGNLCEAEMKKGRRTIEPNKDVKK